LPAPTAVLALSREELASYMLESMNTDPHLVSGERSENIRNYVSSVADSYGKNEQVTTCANSAWRWLVDNEYLTPDVRQVSGG
jgi:hypothetical protein